MKYCTHCGAELTDDAAYCTKCGCPTNEGQTASNTMAAQQGKAKESGVMLLIAYIVALVVTVLEAIAIIPLFWNIPFCVYLNKLRNGAREHSLVLDICILIFNNLVSGILLILDGVLGNQY